VVLKEGEKIASRYEILHKIGFGGMALVYKALDTKLNRQVTVKVMREEYAQDEDFIKRFQKEAHAAAGLSHQNLVSIYDVGNEDLTHYMVMEYIDGYTLKELIKKKAPFTNEETLGVAIQIASALEHAHKSQVVHRDIKPQNILITPDGTVKVTDFGIARVSTDSTQTVTSKTMGSVHYFSPEQARGGYTDCKSDIYSLGIVMYEMATGKIPFDGDTPVAIALKHINNEIPDIRNLNPMVSESLVRIIKKATEKQSAKRYQTMEAMGNDLKRSLGNATGDFVTETAEEEDENTTYDPSSTVNLSDEEIKAIKQEAKAIFFNEDMTSYDKEREYDDELEYNDEREYENGRAYENERVTYDDERAYDNEPEYDEDEFEPELNGYDSRKGEGKIIAAAIVTSIAIIILLCVIAYRVFNKTIIPPAPVTIETPRLIGENFDVAVEKYKNQHITITVKDKVYNDEHDEGIIIDQTPAESEQIEENSIIYVTVSDGTGKIAIPNLVGMTIDGLNEMYENGDQPFDVKIEEENSEFTPLGEIARQDPEYGTYAVPGDTIIAYMSIGPAIVEVSVPNIVGMTEAAAKAALYDVDLEVGLVSKAPSSLVDSGLVISQSVDSDKTLPAGSPVSFTVSTGPPPATAPDNNEPETTATNPVTETTPPATTKRTLAFKPANVPEGMDMIHYKVVKFTSEMAAGITIEEDTIPIGSFPISVEVSGTGQAEFLFSIYYDGAWRLQGTNPVIFDD